MTWLKIDEYIHDDVCSICQDEYGIEQAIYKTGCGHRFHNDCLVNYCLHSINEEEHGELKCPFCRGIFKEYECMEENKN